jgi:glycosyltransferase involved in cell wall biosynthesis
LPAVTVVITAFMHREFVLEALRSVIDQTFSDFEIIVVDDGSRDGTSMLLEPLIRSGKITYVAQTNLGPAAARNRGLTLAAGEFIAFLDDDDRWPPDKLEWQVISLKNNAELTIVAGGIVLIDEKGTELRTDILAENTVSFELLFYGNPFHSPGQTLIRTERLRAIGGFNTSIWGSDDFDAWFRLAKTGGILQSRQIALYYRQHPGNASKNIIRMLDQGLKVVSRHSEEVPVDLRQELKARGYRSLYKSALRKILNKSKDMFRKRSLSGVFELTASILYLGMHAIRYPGAFLILSRDLLRRKWIPKKSPLK